MKRTFVHSAVIVGIVALLGVSAPAWTQTAPFLGVADQFGCLANSGVTGATGSGVVVEGDVGSSPTATITNFPPSTAQAPWIVHFTNDAVVQQARIDAIAAYGQLFGQTPATPLAAQLAGVTLTSGIYSFTSSADISSNGVLTLNGGGVFVFKVGSALTANVGSSVTGTADPCNVYWQIGTSAVLSGTEFWGTVIADASITLGSSSDLIGRALAGTGPTGAVTMSGSGGNRIDRCASLPLTGPGDEDCPTITLSPASLPAGKVGEAYSQQITASGGTGTYTFAVISGTLPDGLTLTSGGLLSGTPTAAGSFFVTIEATDEDDCPGLASYTLLISLSDDDLENCPTITLSPATLPDGSVGVFYSQLITASGGTGPYTFAVTSGTLPAGMTLSPGGLLSGTPTAVVSATVTIGVIDDNGCPGQRVFDIDIALGRAVPTLPQAFVVLLALGLGAAGASRLRRQSYLA